MRKKVIESAVMASFIGEIEAFKPGNVSSYADGHNMTAEDFLISAEVSAPLLCEKNCSLGARVLNCVKATKKSVACNTNLGMLLLFTPIIMAAELGFESIEKLKKNLEITLTSLTKNDANQVFEAIFIANPGGLGKTAEQDVTHQPDCSLLHAMELASHRDSVALQYSNNFSEVFKLGFPAIKDFDKRWNSVKWSTVSCYLTFMASIKDSHIERKYGSEIAEQIKIKSGIIVEKFNNSIDPEASVELLRGFDRELKARNYNPGTSADLTATSLLVYNLIN
jgi:triphosphoribosyl-dephospho-CoA synthase